MSLLEHIALKAMIKGYVEHGNPYHHFSEHRCEAYWQYLAELIQYFKPGSNLTELTPLAEEIYETELKHLPTNGLYILWIDE